ncbi:MAG: sigma-54 dependent transcriptional regulator [Thermodesulfovibrionales bacterium]|nr:sigma-54 dependent transcriptional regulator [Thermodesulfovibrionales bacterium]
MKRALVIDDEQDMALALKESLKRCGFDVSVFSNPIDALSRINLSDFSVIVTDMKMPKMSGLEFISEVRKKGLFVPIIVITGFGTVENAVDAMKLGATDYIMKPFSFETLKEAIQRVTPSDEYEIVAHSPQMQKILSVAKEVAETDISILLSGESGTGKEVIARYIHKMSNRREKPFIAINCAAISESLLESELFGYEKGAFTGASERRLGKFELAHEGTLLLDEISEMAFNLQAKLLRVIQEKEIDRIGGRFPIPVNVRIIATTNRELHAEVKNGRFREDLYYRLNVFPIKIPPLRERKDDIIPLSEYFVKRLSNKLGRSFKMGVEFKEFLLRKTWEGNVRELENFLYRIAVLSRSEELYIPEDELTTTNGLQTSKGTVKDVERELILKTLNETGWNKTKAAEILGVTSRTIRNKLKEYGIKR